MAPLSHDKYHDKFGQGITQHLFIAACLCLSLKSCGDYRTPKPPSPVFVYSFLPCDFAAKINQQGVVSSVTGKEKKEK